jgi:hypothetical protein
LIINKIYTQGVCSLTGDLPAIKLFIDARD